MAQALGAVQVKPSKAELKRRKTAILGSKVGMLLGTLHGELGKNRQVARERGEALTVREFDRVLAEVMEVLVLIRDAYVDERCPR